MITKTVSYRVGEVYLCKYGSALTKLEIMDVADGVIKHDYGWEYAKDWQEREPIYYGRYVPKRFLGFTVGWKIDRSEKR